MTKHGRTSGLLPVIACLAAGCAAPGYNPPEGPDVARNCPVNEVWVCRDHYPSRLDSEHKPDMICTCQDPLTIH